MKALTLYIILPVATSVVGSFIYDGIKGIAVFTTFSSVLHWIWSTFVSILTLEIKLWIIFFGLLSLRILQRIRKTLDEREIRNRPEWSKYTSGVLRKWLWTWRYNFQATQDIAIENLVPYCPHCACQLQAYNTLQGRYYRCPNHPLEAHEQETFAEYEDPEEIRKLILHRIASGSYPKA